jgi:hypothetical protein
MLEKLGSKTRYSCEGHPDGFYIMFEADYELAFRIAAIGFFTIELWWRQKNTFSLRMSLRNSRGNIEDRNQTLRWAAAAWEAEFGKLALPRMTSKDRVEQRRVPLEDPPVITQIGDSSSLKTTIEL